MNTGVAAADFAIIWSWMVSVNRFGRGRQPAAEMVSEEVVRLLNALEAAKVTAC